jgi:hypothetical protein
MYSLGSWLMPIWFSANATTYFENMSRAMALTCRGIVYVMSDTPSSLPTQAIWYDVELPTLQAQYKAGLITSVTVFDSNGQNAVNIPLSPTAAKREINDIEIQEIMSNLRKETHLHARGGTCSTANTEEP